MFEHYRVIHFVGIGGIGMSGIAEILFNLGYKVTGSDVKNSDTSERLGRMGIKIQIGHKAENIDNAHVVVISSAIARDNPEVLAAKERLIPVIPRAEMLAELGRLKYGILVAGAHGKTTTTSLISTIFANSGLDPTIVIGGKLKAFGTNARLGQGEFIIAEADESDGSFLKLSPTIAVVTNIDREHMDFFKTMDSLKDAFASFVNKVPFYGCSIICIENDYLKELLPSIHRKYITYGFSKEADIFAADIRSDFMSSEFNVFYRGEAVGAVRIPLLGMHNILNSLASIAVALELKIDFAKAKAALEGFSGIQRRLEFKGEACGVRVFDDYGHHPTEIRATIMAAGEGLVKRGSAAGAKGEGQGRLFVLFQPHRYTRTKELLSDFAGSFSGADALYLTDIYPAGEPAIYGINSEILFERIKETGHKDVTYSPDVSGLITGILSRLKEGDVLITLGAGDVWKAGEEILGRLKKESI